jgi:hypothetical protein
MVQPNCAVSNWKDYLAYIDALIRVNGILPIKIPDATLAAFHDCKNWGFKPIANGESGSHSILERLQFSYRFTESSRGDNMAS